MTNLSSRVDGQLKKKKREKKIASTSTEQETASSFTMAAAVTRSQPSGTRDILTLLQNVSNSLSSAEPSLPSAKRDESVGVSIEPPQDGISLLDTKNDILLSYLHNLVFLILFQLREISPSKSDLGEEGNSAAGNKTREEVIKKLVELRIYLDRGIKPLEGRLKYQVDKVIKAAEDAERAEREAQAGTKNKTKKALKPSHDDESASEDNEDDSESGSEDEDEDDEEEEEDDIDEMAYRPNVSAFSKDVEPQAKPDKSASKASSDGIYRPPRIMPTAPPTNERREREERRQVKSNVIDEFVASEMSSAPMAEVSIGSTIRSGGRHTRTRKEKEYEAERQAYEETNFVRLPKESKKEQAKKRNRESTFGGEEWKILGEGADRISRLTQRAKGSGSALERSRKRKLTTEDRPRSDGVGNVFEKRRKKVDSWKR